MPETSEVTQTIPQGFVVEKDKKEQLFEHQLERWLRDEIDYDTLMKYLPDKYKSAWQKFMEYFSTKNS